MNNDLLWQGFCLNKIDPSWKNFFQQEAQKDYFFPLLAKLDEEYKNYKCWPKRENIFLEFSQDLNCSLPSKGNLLPWVKEGVFLLNTALTVRDGQALSHMNWWKEFIYSLLIFLKSHDEKLIWVFWGQKAKKIGEECQIGNNHGLISAHPSPYSAEHGFFGSQPFSKANKLLLEVGKEKINWLSILELNLI